MQQIFYHPQYKIAQQIMGNEKSLQFRPKPTPYPYKVQTLPIYTKVNLQNVNFQASHYNIEQEKFKPFPIINKDIRDSQFANVLSPELSENSYFSVIIFLKTNAPGTEYNPVSSQWRIIKYNQGGHFLEHCDRQKQLEDHIHFGTQIWIPPLAQIPHDGGELVISTQNGERQLVSADPKQWTLVILPLGTAHQVNKVTKGFRISYVKQIWLKEDCPIETDQDRLKRQLREARDRQLQQVYRKQQKQRDKQLKQQIRKRMANRKNWPPGHLD